MKQLETERKKNSQLRQFNSENPGAPTAKVGQVSNLSLPIPEATHPTEFPFISYAARGRLTPQVSHQPDYIISGTQVVALVGVRGTNNSLVHPRGAVGVVTRTPAVDGEKFLVRFPDGFESAFDRAQLDILKHFKDRLGSVLPASCRQMGESECQQDAGNTFHIETCIMHRCVIGSRAYGLDTDASDTDRRGQAVLASQYLENDVTGFQDDAVAVRKHFKKIEQDLRNQLSREAKRKAMAAAPKSVKDEGGSDASNARSGSANARSEDGIRWKHAMHLLRLLLTGAATLREGEVPVRVEAHRDRLLAVKRGEIEWTEVDAWRKELHRDFERALAETKLPERPDYEAANQFLIMARKQATTL